jgi:putative DNA primase/helicase
VSSLKTAAAKYASLGWGVIPLHWILEDGSCSCARVDCESEGKHPLGEHGASEPMLDPELVARQWDQTPQANIGLVAGASRKLIVDIDSVAARERFEDICDLDTFQAMQDAPISKTGKGWHLVYEDPSGDYSPSVGKDADLGIDIRAGVSYIVAPPSIHKSGVEYKWIQNAPPSPAPMVTRWLDEYIRARKDAKEKLVVDESTQISQGSRNMMLTELAGAMRRRGFSQVAIEAALLAENQRICKPPLSDREVSNISKSVASYPPSDVPLYMPTVSLDDLVAERAEDDSAPRYKFLSEAEIAALPPIDYLVDRVLPRNGYGLMYGRRGSYKTFDALDLALSITTGKPYHDLETHAAGSVVAYVMSEGSGGLSKRLAAWKQARDVDEIPGFYALTTSVPLPDPKARAELAIALDNLPEPPSLIVFDTLARSISGLDENKSQDMTQLIGIIDELRERYPTASIVMVHHAGWNTTHERGSTVIGDAADWIIKLQKDEETGIISCKTEKVKDDEPPAEWRCSFLSIGNTGSGILAPDSSPIPIDPDLELIVAAFRSMSTASVSWREVASIAGFDQEKSKYVLKKAKQRSDLEHRGLRLHKSDYGRREILIEDANAISNIEYDA